MVGKTLEDYYRMKFNRRYFYSQYRKELGKLRQSQVDNLNLILNMAEEVYPFNNLEQFAYVLATIYHETARTFEPLEEFGKGKGRKYGRKVGQYNKAYYGRGYVQLTWHKNYQKQSQKLGMPLDKYPELVMKPEAAWKIIAYGMVDGDFTGKKLDDYINQDKVDYYRARKIVNGMDRAGLIAKYAKKFKRMLKPIPDKKTHWQMFLDWLYK